MTEQEKNATAIADFWIDYALKIMRMYIDCFTVKKTAIRKLLITLNKIKEKKGGQFESKYS